MIADSQETELICLRQRRADVSALASANVSESQEHHEFAQEVDELSRHACSPECSHWWHPQTPNHSNPPAFHADVDVDVDVDAADGDDADAGSGVIAPHDCCVCAVNLLQL
jgi:hypothetical protein